MKINILYLNSSSDLVEFPDLLFIADLDESSSQQQVVSSSKPLPPSADLCLPFVDAIDKGWTSRSSDKCECKCKCK